MTGLQCLEKRIPYQENAHFTAMYTYQNQPTVGLGDPYLFTDAGKYYVTGTNNGVSFRLRMSENLTDWTDKGLIFSTESEGAWGTKDYWQPQILKGADGRFYLYYCAHYPPSGFSRIGVAVCDRVDGPYTEVYGRPLFDFGYSVIDPHLFVDEDGRIYLYYSRGLSQNFVNGIRTSQIYVLPMQSMTEIQDGAQPICLTTPVQEWELHSGDRRWNEGPDVLKHKGMYYLFWSANNYATRSYSIGYALSRSPMGPFTKVEDNPVLATPQKNISGPGNNSFFHSVDGKEFLIAYHVHRFPDKPSGDRVLYIDRCGFREDDTFYINGPTNTPQPAVSGTSPLQRLTTADFTVEASSCGADCSPQNAYNGQIGIHERLARYEWVSDKTDTRPFWKITFAEPQAVRAVFVYSSTVAAHRPVSYDVILDDGRRYTELPACEMPGEATVLAWDSEQRVQSICVVPHEETVSKPFGLADVQLFFCR